MYAFSRHDAAPGPPLLVRRRALVVWSSTTALAGGVGLLAGPPAVASLSGLWRGEAPGFAELLVGGCAAGAAVAAAWLWLVTTDVVVGLLRGRAGSGRRPRVGAVRGVVLAACGVAVLGSTTTAATAAPPAPGLPAVATDADTGPDAPRSGRRLLDGLPLPDRATGRLPAREPRAARPPVDPGRPDHHRVHPGDCLWTIAALHLGPGATPTEIAAYWRRVHAVNAAVIGPDPDLVHPGQVLQLPPLT